MEAQKIQSIYKKLNQEYRERTIGKFDDLMNEETYKQHADMIIAIGTFLLARYK